jgi:hypothetical protein
MPTLDARRYDCEIAFKFVPMRENSNLYRRKRQSPVTPRKK